MTGIVPRWEWRSFGRRFGEAEKRLAALTPSGVQESDEIYLLSRAGGNVKIRDALMDIKVLRRGQRRRPRAVDAGHEGGAFRSGAADAAKVFEALRLPRTSQPSASGYTLDEFIERICRAGRCDPRGEGPQAAHALHGRRLHGRTLRRGGERQAHPHDRRRVGGCGGGHPGRAGARPGRLHQQPAIPAAWRPWSMTTPARYAVIDVGTNSVKFHIGEHDVDGKWRTVVDRAEVTRLGEGLGTQAADHRRRAGANGRRDRGHGRRGEALRRAGDRRRGHGRPADRFQRRRGRRRHPARAPACRSR